MFQVSGFIFQKEHGFTMIELIVTIAILAFGIIGVYAAFSSIIATSYNISTRLTAAYLAQEGLEIVRNIRDTNFIASASNPGINWSDGLLGCQIGCQLNYKTGTSVQGAQDQLSPYNENNFLVVNESGLYSYSLAGQQTPFTRKITITGISSDTLKVDVVVFWNYNGQEFNFQTESYLYNWY